MTNIKIGGESEYLQALAYVEPFFDQSPEVDTQESEEIMAMIEAVVRYEEQHYPVEAPVPEVLLAFRREQMGLTDCTLQGINLA